MATVTSNPQHQSSSESSCTEIPFELVNGSSAKLKRVPVCSGVCVPKGTLLEAGEWLVEAGGAHLPAQTTVLNRWSDGSVRWMLVRFVAGRIAVGRTSCMLIRPDRRARHFSAVTSLRKINNQLHLQISDAHRATEHHAVLAPELYDSTGRPCELSIDSVATTTTGDVCCVFEIKMRIPSFRHSRLLMSVEVWPSQGLIKTTVTFRNSSRARHKGGLWDLGDDGSLHFSGLHLKIATPGGGSMTRWRGESDNRDRACHSSDPVHIVQHGSGTRNWSSTSHVDRSGQVCVADRGYTIFSSAGTHRGYQSSPTVSLVNEDSQLMVAIPEFWQQFPGSLTITEDVIDAGLFPMESGPFELQGGEQKTHSLWACLCDSLPGLNELSWVHEPPQMVQSVDWFRQARVIEWLPAAIESQDRQIGRLKDYLEQSLRGERSMNHRRAAIDEFGWRNFGDVPADHEQTNYAGSNTVVSHYNNQFDLIFGGIQNMVVSGDNAWCDLYDPLARHVIDIDIYHTMEDRGCFNGGLFWHTDHYLDAKTATHRTYSAANASADGSYGGGPSNEHNYTTGLLYYYFLTGHQPAADAVRSLADWVIGMDDGSQTVFGLFDDGPTGLASQTKYEDFHGPGRGVGNSINALLDAFILTGDARYENKMEELIRRAIHPRQDCDKLELLNAEKRWSYTVCMTALGRVLHDRLEAGKLDELYEYIRLTLENYGRWMLKHERPSLSAPAELEFVTEAWAAQDFRKANALRIAASCTDDKESADLMRKKADELNDAAWHDLYQFGEAHLTARCLSIVMTEGLRDVFHRTESARSFPPADGDFHFGDSWTMFTPQKTRVRQLIRNPVQLLSSIPRVLRPARLLRAISAIRRQLG